MSFRRIAGYAGIGAVVLLVVTNLFTGQAPDMDAAPAEVAEYYADYDTWKSVLMGNLLVSPLLFLFIAGVYSLGRDRDADTRPWAVVALLGLLSAFTSIVGINATDVTLAATSGLSADVVDAIWTLNGALWGFQLVSLAVLLLGFGMMTLQAGIGARWAGLLALFGAACALLGGLAVPMGIEDGSPLVFIGFAGFLIWMIWIVATSLWLVRTSDASTT